MQCTNKLPLCIVLSSFSFLRASEKISLLNHFNSIEELSKFSLGDLSFFLKRPLRTKMWNQNSFSHYAERCLKLMKIHNINITTCEEDNYPFMLKEIFDPPFALFYRGSLQSLKNKAISVVGTRKPTCKGAKAAFDLAYDLVANDFTVISGLAIGIDAAAHKGALAAQNEKKMGSTVAVLACGVDCLYPVTNKTLGAKIIQDGGCILSEYPPDEPPQKWRFPARNRIISGLSNAVAVVEAPEKSGALITADFALEQGRDVMIHKIALEYPCMQKDDSKNHSVFQYVRDGAPVIEDAKSLLQVMNDCVN